MRIFILLISRTFFHQNSFLGMIPTPWSQTDGFPRTSMPTPFPCPPRGIRFKQDVAKTQTCTQRITADEAATLRLAVLGPGPRPSPPRREGNRAGHPQRVQSPYASI